MEIKLTIDKDGGATLALPSLNNVTEGEYVFTDNLKEDNTDVYKHYYGGPVQALLDHAIEVGKTINDKPMEKKHADAWLMRKALPMDKINYDFDQYALFRPIVTKRDLGRTELIAFVNACCSIVAGMTGKTIPMFREK